MSIDLQTIHNRIIEVREQRVMLDFHLSDLYGVQTKVLKQAVRRNIERFPKDFMFELTRKELDFLRSQFVTFDWKPATYVPFVFTEQGVAMLSSVLKSQKAIQVNVELMRAFVQLRKLVLENSELLQRIEEFEKKYDKQFEEVFTALRYLIDPPEKERRKIGYKK